jgi:hypothetical protein
LVRLGEKECRGRLIHLHSSSLSVWEQECWIEKGREKHLKKKDLFFQNWGVEEGRI